MQRATLVLEGRVQKVGLRYFVVEEAEERDITGYVKNLRDGTVEIVCEGKKDDIGSFVEALRRLRKPAVVENVRSEYSESRNEFVDFHIEHEDLDKDEMDKLSDYEKLDRKMDVSRNEITHGFTAATKFLKSLTLIQHKMLDKQDESLAKQGEILSEIRSMSAKQGETLSEIRNMSAKQDESLAKQDESLAKQDETLSEIRSMSAKQDEALAKQDESLAKQDETLSEIRNVSAKQGETVSEIRNMSSNMNAMLDSRFQKLESEIAKIKHKMEI